jgi:hypothetical protein
MNVQLATLCDSAADYSGKLCILGAFDTLCAREFPVVHPHCALALRIQFEGSDVGRHAITIRGLNPAGEEFLPAFRPEVDVSFPSSFVPFVTRNLVLNLQRMKFESAGVYKWVIDSGGEELMTVPLRVTLFDQSRSATGPAG